MPRTLVFSLGINGPAATYSINLSPYIPNTAKFVRITAVTIDGDSDCTNELPLESSIGGYAADGSYQKYFFYNIPKNGTAFYLGSGWDMQLPTQGRLIYISKPYGCSNSSAGGMNVYVYLSAYM